MSEIQVSVVGTFAAVSGSIRVVDVDGKEQSRSITGTVEDAYRVIGEVLQAASGVRIAAPVGQTPAPAPDVPPIPPPLDVTDPSFLSLSTADKIAALQKRENDIAAAERAGQEARGMQFHVTR